MSLRAFGLACSVPWAIQPEALRQILEISTREHIPDFEAVAAKQARRLDGTERVRIRENGVAVIDVTGPIVRYADFFSSISGATSITTLSRDFSAAINDPAVRSILLNLDSPGGEVAGVNEFAQMIFDARGRKPIVAYVDGMAASAAYWIASAADEIVSDATGLIGSIGVIATVPNPGAKGAKDINFVSSQSPKKRPDPTTESGKDQMQNLVDRLADVFVETVARNRSVSVETVLAEYGQGDVYVGRNAVAAGLADRLGSFESLVADLAAGYMPKKKKAAASADEEFDMNRYERLKAGLADLLAKIGADADPNETPTDPEGTEPETAEEAPAEDATAANDGGTQGAGASYEAVADENRKLKEDLAAAKALQTHKDIEAFVSTSLADGKILPVEADSIRNLMLQAAQDDLVSPVSAGTRMDQVKATISGRPSHGLFEEKITDNRHKVVKADANDQTELSDDRRRELLSKTPVGKAALNLVK